MKEKHLKLIIAEYLKYQYPDIIFTISWDQLKLPIHIRALLNKYQSKDKLPDISIDYPSGRYHGLKLEVKRNKEALFTKKGLLRKNEHIQGQSKVLEKYQKLGYCASFIWDFEQAKQTIDDYLLKEIN